MGAYDLLDVKVNGVPTTARPIAWSEQDTIGTGKTGDGNDIKAVEFMTTCNKCAQLIKFDIKSAIDSMMDIKCKACSVPIVEEYIEEYIEEIEEIVESEVSINEILDFLVPAVDECYGIDLQSRKFGVSEPNINCGFVLDDSLLSIASKIIENDKIQ